MLQILFPSKKGKLLRHTSSRMTDGSAKLDVYEKVSKVVINATEIFKKAREPKSSLVQSREQTQPELKTVL